MANLHQRKSSGQSNEDISEYNGIHCCFICMEGFNDNTRTLDCGHMFCEACMLVHCKVNDNIQHEQHGDFMPCATCRKLTKLPAAGIPGLEAAKEAGAKTRKTSQTNDGLQQCDSCMFRATVTEPTFYCNKCMMNFCEECRNTHDQQALFKMHPVIHISNKEIINVYCEKHNKLPSKYFCLDCNQPTCTICVLHQHSGHHTAELREALAMRRDNLRTLLNSLGPKLDRLDTRVKKLLNLCSRRTSFSRDTLEDNKQSSRAKLGSQNGLSSNNIKSVSPEDNSKPLTTLCYQMDRTKKLYDLSAKILEMSQSKKLLIVYDDLMARIRTVLEDEFERFQRDVEDRIESELGSMEFPCPAMFPPSLSNSTFSLQDRMGSISSTDSSNDDVPSVDEPSMLIKPNLVWKIERQSTDAGELYNPCGITFMDDGHLIVSEYDLVNDRNNKLRVIDPAGKSKCVLAQGEIRPLGVAITKDGNIAVTDCKAKRVKIFTPGGKLMTEMGKGQFGWPYGIAVNSRGQIIVTDAFNDLISIYQPDGKKCKQFGSSGSKSGQFKNPYHVTVDTKDNIIVSDSGNNCVKIFDANGQFMYRTTDQQSPPERKNRRRRLHSPRGICVDPKGHILVADDRNRVCMFDAAGRYIRNLLTEEDSVKYPEALSCSSRGHLAVTEWNPNNMLAIKVFCLFD